MKGYLISSCLLAGSVLQPPEARAVAEPIVQKSAHPEIRLIDKELVLEGIKLGRFNINYHQQANKQYRWRGFLYPAIQEAGSACVYANTLADLYQRSSNIHDPSMINSKLLKRGNECALIGQAIKGTSFVNELLQNGHNTVIATRNGYSPMKATAFVQGSVLKMDGLLLERERLVAQVVDPDNQKALALEGRVIKHIRNQLVYQFKVYSCDSREREWQQNSFYLMAAAQNFLQAGATISAIQGFQISRNTPKTAICNITASSIGVVAPILRTATGRCMRQYWGWRLSKLLPTERAKPRTIEELESDWKDLDEYMSDSKDSKQDASSVLGLDATLRRMMRVDATIRTDEARIGHLRRIAQEQAISGPPIEMATLARQICQEVAYSHRNDSHLNNHINLAGRISQASGQTYSLIATPVSAVKAALLQRRLREKGELPSQKLEARLKRLQDLEERVRTLQLVPQ